MYLFKECFKLSRLKLFFTKLNCDLINKENLLSAYAGQREELISR